MRKWRMPLSRLKWCRKKTKSINCVHRSDSARLTLNWRSWRPRCWPGNKTSIGRDWTDLVANLTGIQGVRWLRILGVRGVHMENWSSLMLSLETATSTSPTLTHPPSSKPNREKTWPTKIRAATKPPTPPTPPTTNTSCETSKKRQWVR